MGVDLTAEALAEHLGARPLRAYPALLSTEADALQWARAGAPSGAVVVADYQASPRGRGGWPWTVVPGHGLGFSVVVRPELPEEREGWPYVAVGAALADALGADARTVWPDEVVVDGERAAAYAVATQPVDGARSWAVVTVHLPGADAPRGPLLRRALDAIEGRLDDRADDVVARYTERCATLGARVRARMVPLGPAGVELEGDAVACKPDGALTLDMGGGRRVAVLPQHLGLLDVLVS